ncbi:MAG: hypothetical protein ACI35O_16745 [Bacillaceae bacterium]
MDHVISDLQRWLDVFKESEPDNKKAHECIEKAIEELHKYYPKTKDEYGNPLK